MTLKINEFRIFFEHCCVLDFYSNFERVDTILPITRIARRYLVFCLSMYVHTGLVKKTSIVDFIICNNMVYPALSHSSITDLETKS